MKKKHFIILNLLYFRNGTPCEAAAFRAALIAMINVPPSDMNEPNRIMNAQ